MKNEKTFEIELRIAATGQTFAAEISNVTTAQEIIDAVLTVHYLDPKLGLGWQLLHLGQVLAKDFIILNLVDQDSPNTFELVAKVEGG